MRRATMLPEPFSSVIAPESAVRAIRSWISLLATGFTEYRRYLAGHHREMKSRPWSIMAADCETHGEFLMRLINAVPTRSVMSGR